MLSRPSRRQIDAGVELAQRQSVPLEQTDSIISHVVRRGYAYWQDLRGQRPWPLRRDLDPARIVGLLPFLFMVDVLEDGGDFRYRLIGTDIVGNTVTDNTGKRLSGLRSQGSQAVLAGLYRDTYQSGEPRLQRIAFTTKAGLRSWYECVMLPLGLLDGARPEILLGFAEHFTQPID